MTDEKPAYIPKPIVLKAKSHVIFPKAMGQQPMPEKAEPEPKK